jgi:integrase/recombinase XerD
VGKGYRQVSRLYSPFILSVCSGKGWCAPTLANTIDAPRLFAFENLPQILSWTDVQRLLAGITGPDPTDIRDRALIMLLAIYGLRMKEVLGLKLADFDWTHERLNVHRSKQRKSQEFPLSKEVGDAVIRYLHEVRPRTSCRHVFVTERMPHRPYGRTGLRKEIAFRLKSLGIPLEHYGPHVLRHASAYYTTFQSPFILKTIGLGWLQSAAVCGRSGRLAPEPARLAAPGPFDR